jgi:predicted Fe-Mo cluster-binding NifX family protein
MQKIRIAAVSNDGIHVDEHFGKAEKFIIYDLGDGMSWVEDRTTEQLSVGDPNHSFDPDKFNRIATVLKDCKKVYVAQIGETPATELKALGIEPVVYQGAIADIQ